MTTRGLQASLVGWSGVALSAIWLLWATMRPSIIPPGPLWAEAVVPPSVCAVGFAVIARGVHRGSIGRALGGIGMLLLGRIIVFHVFMIGVLLTFPTDW